MTEDQPRRPISAALLTSGMSFAVLCPLIFIATAFHKLAGTVEPGAVSAFAMALYALPVVGAVVAGVVGMRCATPDEVMRRGAYLNVGAVIVLLLATLATLSRSKTLMMEGVKKKDFDQSSFETVLAAAHTLDDLVPVAFGLCALGIVVFAVMGRRYSRGRKTP